MSSGEMNDVVDRLRSIALQQDGAPTDGQLLEAFIARRDGPSFEALVQRHAPMVLGVCRRVVGNGHDADDAFQATFLVLVRKARTIVPHDLVGNCLYGVAYRTALKARSLAGRRRLMERPMTDMPQSGPDDCTEMLHLLDRELERLPAKYRLPIILCDLECRTRRDAARQLGLPTGTLSGRLTTAHRLLAKRLARHGFAVSGTALAAVLATQAAAGVPKDIVSSTIKAAVLFAAGSAAAGIVPGKVAVLTEGVLKTMLLTKLKLALAVVAGVLVVGAGVLALESPGSGAAQPPRGNPAGSPAKPIAAEEDQARSDLEAARAKAKVAANKVIQAEAELTLARQQLKQAEADYQRARLQSAKPSEKPAPPAAGPNPGGSMLKARGYLRPVSVVQVTAGIAGKVTEVHVQEGDLVKAGQVLATLDAGSFRNEYERAQVNVQLAEARLQEARAEHSEDKPQHNASAARVLIAATELKRAEVELKQAKSQLEKTQLYAPIAGIVTRRQVEVGDVVNPAQGQPAATRLFELIDPRTLLASVPIAERDAGAVFLGQHVRIQADSLPGTIREGRVARIAPTIDPATATVTVQVALTVSDGHTRWKPGMSVVVEFLPKE